MTESSAGGRPADAGDDGISLLVLGSQLLRRRRLISALVFCGMAVGLTAGLLSRRVYSSSSTFIPQGSDLDANSALLLAASQLGVRMPAANGAWGPSTYVEILTSLALLEPIARDTVVVVEKGGRRVALMDLLEIDAPTAALRTERAVRALRKIVNASEVKALGSVRVTVTTIGPACRSRWRSGWYAA